MRVLNAWKYIDWTRRTTISMYRSVYRIWTSKEKKGNSKISSKFKTILEVFFNLPKVSSKCKGKPLFIEDGKWEKCDHKVFKGYLVVFLCRPSLIGPELVWPVGLALSTFFDRSMNSPTDREYGSSCLLSSGASKTDGEITGPIQAWQFSFYWILNQ